MAQFEPIYRLRVSESEKYATDGKWFRDYMQYVIPYDTTVVHNYEQMKLWYDVVNGNIEGFKDKLKEFCKPSLPSEISKEIDYDEDIIHYDRLFSKYQYLIGEMMRRADDLHAAVISQEGVEIKNKELREEIQRAVEETMMLAFELTDMKMSGVNPLEIEDYQKEMGNFPSPEEIAQTEFRSSLEIFANRVMTYAKNTEDILTKKTLTFKHGITADRYIAHIGELYGKPGITIINPLHCGFHKPPDEFKIEKGDYVWSRTSITMAAVFNDHGDVLKQEDIEKLSYYTYSSSLAVNKRHSVIGGGDPMVTYDTTSFDYGVSMQDVHRKTTGQAQGTGTNRRWNNQRLIFRTHFNFKAFRRLVFLSYKDDMGKEVTEVYADKFEIPDHAQKYNFINRYKRKSSYYEWVDEYDGKLYRAETLWVPRNYEITRLGQDVYLNYREVPNQPFNIDDPYGSFELCYKGRVLTSVNTESISLIGRALPYQFQYNLVKHLQNRELVKYEGFIRNTDIEQIPDYLVYDENGEPIEGLDKFTVWKMIRRYYGEALYSPSQSSNGLPNPQRSVVTKPEISGQIAEIVNMENFLALLDRQMGLAMAVPIQAEGQYADYSNSSDNQRALNQGYTMIEWYIYAHTDFWKSIFNEYLKQFRNYYIEFFRENPDVKETFLNYVLPGDTKSLLRITPEILELADMGVFVTNSTNDEKYRQLMMGQIQAFSQNAGEGVEMVSGILKAIVQGESPEQVHKMIQIGSRKQQEIAQQMQAQQMQNAERMQKMQLLNREDEQQHEKEKIILQESLRGDTDEIPAELEAAKIIKEMQQGDRKLDIEERKILSNK